ncbi:MAG: exo-alpha-sialidase [Nonlabens sp.]|uniref:WD40/YVTN/BNR-like repeat-containing protein n=1 Tax=Nonlabens sp. TaxID=1888209 RepID=UPI00321B5E6D
MKKLLFMAGIILITACKENLKNTVNEQVKVGHRNDVTIEIHEVLTDSISIRALDYGDRNYWFSGSDGQYGRINANTNQVKKSKVTFDENEKLEYRSIAVTDQYTYILSAGNPALIYKITHANDEVKLVYKEVEERVFYDSMKFWNDQEGIAFGDPTEDCLSVIKTFDGGDTWAKCKCNYMPRFIKGEAAFAASNSNIALYKDNVWLATGGAAARIFHSKDRGSNWEEYATPIIAGGEMTGIYAIDFIDENRGVMIGGDWNKKEDNLYNKAITYDGGKNWKYMNSGNGPGYSSDIIFVPETDGNEILTVSSEGIWWSGNQGESWKQLSKEGFYTVHMINSKEGFLAGRNRVSSFLLK